MEWIIDGLAVDFDVQIWEQLLRVLGAALLGAVFGFEREMKSKPAGFITFMLVSMGSCLIALLQINIINMGRHEGVATGDVGRIIAQVVSGIGFLGAGTIIHNHGSVKGITTAALLWVSAAIGLLIGIGGVANYILALSATFLFFPLSLVSRRWGRKFAENHRVHRIYIVFEEQHEKELYEQLATNGAVVKKTFFHNKYVKQNKFYKEVYIYFSMANKKTFNSLIETISTDDWVVSIEEA